MKVITNNAHQDQSIGYNPVEYWQRKCIEYANKITELRSEVNELRVREKQREVDQLKHLANRSISFGLVK